MPRLYELCTARSERRMGRLRRELLADLGGAVLEIGAGIGPNLPLYPPGARVAASDLDPRNVRHARRRHPASPHALLAAAAQDLPFGPATFDHVVATLVLCSVPSQRATLAELARVLRSGGRLHLLEHTLTGRPLLDGILNAAERPWRWATGGCHPNRATAATLAAAGWQLVRHERLAGGLLRLLVAAPPA